MPTPFPGMDPYLEDPAFWPDFHQSFVTYCRDAIGDRLPDNYEARIDERVNLVELPPVEVKQIKPDIALTQTRASSRGASTPAGTLTLEPVTVPLMVLDEFEEAYIRILHRPDRTLVAVLEVLSPSNKIDPGRGDYLAKRNAVLRQAVHLVELDLLVGGHRLPTLKPLPSGDYYAFVSRRERRFNADVYAWTVRQPLPTIPIPLKTPDPDIHLPLSEVFATTYERGRYARSLNYRAPPSALLTPDDLNWATEIAKRIGG